MYTLLATESVVHFVVNIFWVLCPMLGACVPRRAVWMRSEFYVTEMIAWIGSFGPSCRVKGAQSACFDFGLLLARVLLFVWAGLLLFVLATGVVDQLLWRGPMSLWGERCKMS